MNIGKWTYGTLKPSCMILGSQKAGTSSLYYYLSQHPQVVKPKTKELHFFDQKVVPPINEYHKAFPKGFFRNKISLEATPRYLYYPETAERLYHYNPHLKFIVLLRDPVKRAFSAWNMYRQLSKEPKAVANSKLLSESDSREKAYMAYYAKQFPSFEKAIENELSQDFDAESIEPSLIRRGYYKDQIEGFFKYFERKQFLFIEFETLISELETTLDRVTHFLGIRNFNSFPWDREPRNKRTYENILDVELYQNHQSHFQQKNHGLEELTGLSLPWMHQNT